MSAERLRSAIRLLALAGLGISAYLTYTRYADAAIACSISRGCELVESSSYAVIAGVPVAVIGVAGYASILAASLLGPRADRLVLGLTTVAAGFGVYLLLVQFVAIEAICQWCVASEAISFALLGLALAVWRRAAPVAVPALHSTS